MKNIIFIAPPAAGKGTQSQLLSEKYNIPHISTGDLLREEMRKETSLGIQIKSDMDQGNFISDEIVTELLKKRLLESDCNNGYILDGYPRNVSQAKRYESLIKELNKELGIVIFLDIDEELALERTINRVICPNCKASYNLMVEALKPKSEGICDKCHTELKIRNDDTKEVFLNRFKTYLEKTKDLIEYYQDKNVLKTIKVQKNSTPNDLFLEIKEIISK